MNYCLRQYELLSRKRLNMNYRLRRYELFAKGECEKYGDCFDLVVEAAESGKMTEGTVGEAQMNN